MSKLNKLRVSEPAEKQIFKTLILDDQAFDRSRIRRMARRSKLPLSFFEARSISAMSNAISENAFDLFLLDYQLPEGNGLKAVEIIRSQSANRNAALIMITGNEEPDLAATAFEQGCDDLIIKGDLSVDLLKSSIKSALFPINNTPTHGLFESEQFHRRMRDSLRNQQSRDDINDGLRRLIRRSQDDDRNNELESFERFMREFLRDDSFRFK